ncbi:hypothetical protein HDU79_005838 [Rhizoclosmatium sp. JEL0117]|nr:hypothetical protein HDU79_005838 [Rhizoclosmatium sp. JEL0117]
MSSHNASQQILSLLTDIQSQLKSMDTRLTALESTQSTLLHNPPPPLHSLVLQIHQSQREMSAQLQKLQNPTRKFYTRFMNLPSEILTHIFSWISPKKVLKFRRLGKVFNAILLTKYFAVINLKRFVGGSQTESTTHHKVWLVWPKTFQDVYCDMRFGSKTNLFVKSFRKMVFAGGSIPSRIGSLQQMTSVMMTGCRLNGEIPGSFCQLINLESLDLSLNNLSGTIPARFHNCHALKELLLNNNSLAGPLPLTLFQATSLVSLNLSFNKLSGSLPTQIYQLHRLQILNISSNNLNGPLPAQLGTLIHLKTLKLGLNEFTSEIPTPLGGLLALRQLSLKNNRLTGSIPRSISHLRRLETLDLSENRFQGEIPVEFSQLVNLETLSLYSNCLSGLIPEELGGLERLSVLLLSDNEFEGGTPVDSLRRLSLTETDVPGLLEEDESDSNEEEDEDDEDSEEGGEEEL